jgi:hypothetical protein
MLINPNPVRGMQVYPEPDYPIREMGVYKGRNDARSEG